MQWLSRIAAGIPIVAMLLVPVPAMAAHRLTAAGRPVVVRTQPRFVRPYVRPYAPVIVRPYVVRPYPYFYYGYGPGWYGYNWGPGWYYPSRQAATGEVKIDTHLKNASIYVDGGYVGPIEKFKKFDLTPGNHEIELRDVSGQTILRETVQVLVGKTVEIRMPE